jgi:hypothetical protein
MMKRVLVLLCLGAVLAGCGSSKHASTNTTPKVLPAATTPDEWARRVVARVLRPLNNDLRVVNGFASPQIRSYIVTQNATTISTIRSSMGDLQRCTTKLDVVGPPPAGEAQLRNVNASLRKACAAYAEVAAGLLRATDLLSSGRQDGVAAGDKELRKVTKPSQAAAADLVDAVRVAQNIPAFRRAGLKPSV